LTAAALRGRDDGRRRWRSHALQDAVFFESKNPHHLLLE